MKKTLSMILCLAMLLSLLVSCNDTNEESSIPDMSGAPDVSDVPVDGLDKFFTISLPKERDYINVAGGLSYTFNREAHQKYGDSDNKLTDAKISDPTSTDGWVGFLGKDDIEITLDLGERIEGLCGFAIDTLVDSGSGRNTPRLAELYASDDGENYIKAASSAVYSITSGSAKVSTVEGYTEKGFSARYVKLRLSSMVVNWAFLDSLRIYTCTEKEDKPGQQIKINSYYKNDPMPTVDSEIYWDSADADYSKDINLIKGLPQRIYEDINLAQEVRTSYYNTPASTKALTDGRNGSSNYMDEAYAHFTGGEGRNIIYDIGKLSTVKSVKVSTMVYMYGIEVPEMIMISLSEDGKEWQRVAVGSSGEFVSVATTRSEINFDFGSNGYKTRFVKVTIKNSTHCWMDEITVMGTKKVDSSAKKLEGESASVANPYDVNAYPSLDVLGGSENIYLAYNYKTENPEAGLRSKEQYKPLVGYYDNDKKLQDFFFDSFLYLPCSTTTPSGAVLWEDESQPSIKSDWLDYYDDTFKEGYNIRALNEAVGEIKTELNKPDYQAYVYLSIFSMPRVNFTFGDVDGDGISENGAKLEDRKKVAKWWIDLNIEAFKKNNLDNLKLNGFYWYDESIGLGDSSQREYVTYVVDYLHSMGYYVIWIPYFMAGGYSAWKTVGFDCANMQPNYTFNDTATEERLYDNAALAKKYGLGVEIEADGRALSAGSDRFDRYMAYLRVGVEEGYMNTIKMYYFDAVPGVILNAYNSTDPKVHQVYDATYLYAKRKLSFGDDIDIKDEIVELNADNEAVGNLEFESMLGKICMKYSPLHGSFALSRDGKYKYKPDEGFVGEDRVILSLSYGKISKEYVIKFNVKAVETEESSK